MNLRSCDTRVVSAFISFCVDHKNVCSLTIWMLQCGLSICYFGPLLQTWNMSISLELENVVGNRQLNPHFKA